jgi:GT2 family glycosyltransferase
MEHRVAIVILTYNSEPVIEACLESVLQIDYPHYEVFVVDNNSGDRTKEVVRKFGEQVRLLENKENLGFSGGNNVGIRIALEGGFNYVLLLNPDTEVTPEFLGFLLEVSEKDDAVGMVTPKTLYPDGEKRILYAGGVIDWSMARNYHRGQGDIDEGQYDEVEETNFASGASLLVKKEVVAKIGLLDEKYFLYYEDADWCLRAKAAGYKITYQPRAVIYHQESTATRKGSPNYYYYFTRNRLYFVKKFFSRRAAGRIYFLEALRFVKNFLKLFRKGEREQSLAILAGIYDFVRGRMGKRG